MLRAIRERMGERGSAALEMALSMPILLGVSAGVVEFGKALDLRQTLVSAASEAARAGTQLTCPRPTNGEVLAAVAATLDDAGLDPSIARIALTNTGGEPGTDMTVRVAYDAYLPILSKLFHLSSLGPEGRMEILVEVAAENE
jgi:Flp pilus assembly protein TadG